jgi:hypothetical protein
MLFCTPVVRDCRLILSCSEYPVLPVLKDWLRCVILARTTLALQTHRIPACRRLNTRICSLIVKLVRVYQLRILAGRAVDRDRPIAVSLKYYCLLRPSATGLSHVSQCFIRNEYFHIALITHSSVLLNMKMLVATRQHNCFHPARVAGGKLKSSVPPFWTPHITSSQRYLGIECAAARSGEQRGQCNTSSSSSSSVRASRGCTAVQGLTAGVLLQS